MIILVAAMNQHNVIGYKNTLPWHCKEDLKHFKKLTDGKHIVMGRKTFESLPKMLPNRHHIVLTRDTNFSHENVEVFHTIDNLLMTYEDKEDLYIIGGAEIYNQFLSICDKIEMTIINGFHEGDTFFPQIPNPHLWQFIYSGGYEGVCTFLTFTKRDLNDNTS